MDWELKELKQYLTRHLDKWHGTLSDCVRSQKEKILRLEEENKKLKTRNIEKLKEFGRSSEQEEILLLKEDIKELNDEIKSLKMQNKSLNSSMEECSKFWRHR